MTIPAPTGAATTGSPSGGSERRILIVDDGPEVVHLLRTHLRRQGYAVEVATTGAEALDAVERGFSGVIILDLVLPDYEGLELFGELRNKATDSRIIILTAHGTFELVAEAVRKGAFDFLSKGEGLIDRLFVATKNAFESLALQQNVAALRRQLHDRAGFGQIITRSAAMTAVFQQLRQVVDTRITVLIHGESGTGKELVAKAIHEGSGRARGPFIAINCAGIPETLLESELFGYERGAFTGAAGRKLGRFELAHGGTIFLDEIGEMAGSLQAKLLRVLQEREFERVGGTEKVRVDVRVLSATHRDLNAEVDAGRFRQDLYYRLAVFTVHLPPLRDREGDVRLLAHFFAERFAKEEGRDAPSFAEDALVALESYDFPGNVRELENIVHRAAVVCSAGVIRRQDLPPPVLAKTRARESAGAQFDLEESFAQMFPTPESLPTAAELERALLKRALQLTGGHVTQAAELAKVSRATMYRRVAELRGG